MDNKRDLTTGSIAKKMLFFAAPLVAANLLQAIYNIVDMIIVGHFCGPVGMSAVSIGGQITNLVLTVCNGLCNSNAAYIGQLFGAKKMEESKSVVGTLVSFLIILALSFTVLVNVFSKPLLTALNTPEECFSDTVKYLSICMSGTVFIYVYNALSASLRGIGESLNPMLYVLITTIENVFLDLLFVYVLDWGASGAALATIICQFTSMVLVVIFVKRQTTLFDFKLSSFKIYPDKLKNVLKLGLPQSFQYISTNISFLLISSLINTFGVTAAAAAGAANKIWTFGTMPGRSIMTAGVTMTAQNLPKNNYKRIIQGMFCGMGMALAVSMSIFAACQLFPEAMYGLFTDDAGVAEIGVSYLRIYAICFFTEVTMFCTYGVVIGAGYTPVTMVGSILTSFLARTVLAYTLSAVPTLGFNGIAWAYALSPLVSLSITTGFIISGKWKKSRIKL